MFSLGGSWPPRWGKFGKVWMGSGPLKAHLSLNTATQSVWLDGRYERVTHEIPETWEVLEFVIQLDDDHTELMNNSNQVPLCGTLTKMLAREIAERPAKK